MPPRQRSGCVRRPLVAPGLQLERVFDKLERICQAYLEDARHAAGKERVRRLPTGPHVDLFEHAHRPSPYTKYPQGDLF